MADRHLGQYVVVEMDAQNIFTLFEKYDYYACYPLLRDARMLGKLFCKSFCSTYMEETCMLIMRQVNAQ